MDDRRLVVACENDAGAAMLLQVGDRTVRSREGLLRPLPARGDRSCNVLQLARFDYPTCGQPSRLCSKALSRQRRDGSSPCWFQSRAAAQMNSRE